MPDPAPMVLLVDDDASVRRALGRLLTLEGIPHESFTCAEDLLESPALADAACILTDIWLQGMSGLELQNRLGTSHPRLPVILITAQDDEEIGQRAKNAGALAFFRKPFDTGALLECLRRTVGFRVPH